MASKKILLKSSDGVSFEVDEAVAVESQTIKKFIEDNDDDKGIRLNNVTGAILAKVIEYCEKHVEARADMDSGGSTENEELEEELEAWDTKLVDVDQKTLFELIQAADYLSISGLVALVSKKVSDMMKNKTLDQIRELFDIKNDYTPAEEAALREENKWAFE